MIIKIWSLPEGYNGPGSPYWAFKTFILLAVPKDHPYWQAETQPISFPENTYLHQKVGTTIK